MKRATGTGLWGEAACRHTVVDLISSILITSRHLLHIIVDLALC